MTTTSSTTAGTPQPEAPLPTPDLRQETYWDSPGMVSTSEEMTDPECWALATTQSTGRLAFIHDGLLDIFPVNFFVMAERIYFRTSPDGTIATTPLVQAAFQLDQANKEARSGWTIIFNGPVTPVEDPSLLTTLWGKPADEPWAPGQRDAFFTLSPTLVRGRRIGTSH